MYIYKCNMRNNDTDYQHIYRTFTSCNFQDTYRWQYIYMCVCKIFTNNIISHRCKKNWHLLACSPTSSLCMCVRSDREKYRMSKHIFPYQNVTLVFSSLPCLYSMFGLKAYFCFALILSHPICVSDMACYIGWHI